ncbi:12385_t:CDS:2 [Acaulospora colombiana]|uniref:12385_t:CDS:1 n=1 Tax=Acaulospora colombiana TaxID=27376 RepID=A0ACA9MB47_9GLOM|nr:12385_t:CDS:2 [Acaulospora colombiana]
MKCRPLDAFPKDLPFSHPLNSCEHSRVVFLGRGEGWRPQGSSIPYLGFLLPYYGQISAPPPTHYSSGYAIGIQARVTPTPGHPSRTSRQYHLNQHDKLAGPTVIRPRSWRSEACGEKGPETYPSDILILGIIAPCAAMVVTTEDGQTRTMFELKAFITVIIPHTTTPILIYHGSSETNPRERRVNLYPSILTGDQVEQHPAFYLFGSSTYVPQNSQQVRRRSVKAVSTHVRTLSQLVLFGLLFTWNGAYRDDLAGLTPALSSKGLTRPSRLPLSGRVANFQTPQRLMGVLSLTIRTALLEVVWSRSPTLRKESSRAASLPWPTHTHTQSNGNVEYERIVVAIYESPESGVRYNPQFYPPVPTGTIKMNTNEYRATSGAFKNTSGVVRLGSRSLPHRLRDLRKIQSVLT